MTYEEMTSYFEEAKKRGSRFGTERIRVLLDRLDHPERNLEFVHVTGTNGKGSVIAFLSAVLTRCSYRVGEYTSPAVFCYEERFRVGGSRLEKQDLAAYAERVIEADRQMKEEGLEQATLFELETALAFVIFKEEKCDIVLLEAGLGGAGDATSVIPRKVVSVITSVDLDHTKELGKTKEEIAEAKAGIIGPDRPVVYLTRDEEVRDIIERVARERESQTRPVQLERFDHDPFMTLLPSGKMAQLFTYKNYEEIPVTMLGRYEAENAAVAVETLEALSDWGFYHINKKLIIGGMAEARLPGRFELLREHPNLFIDGAHNPAGVRAMIESLAYYFPGQKWTGVMGVFKDKDYPEMVRLCAGQFSQVLTVTPPDAERALPAEELAKCFEEHGCEARAVKDMESALSQAIAVTGRPDVIIVFGSLSILREAKEVTEELERKKRPVL
ncbi:MAG: bifunctional folylpolyglutamate synthase/dihydrofolate synthase [Lachnospiraceae bacterium]|nr:bifunctional folylpolyglutamate synthase/dihydrofolate synthase [Lachnospiraceae bacterium]